MNRILCLIIALLMGFNCFSQEKLVQFNNDLKTSSSVLKDVFPVVNKNTGDIALFLLEAKKIYGYLLSDKFEVISKLASNTRSRKYKKVVGYSINNKDCITLYLTNLEKNKFASEHFNFKTNTSILNEFELVNKEEELVQTAVVNNSFYLLTVNSGSSVLNIYNFDSEGHQIVKHIDFKEQLKGSYGQIVTLSGILSKSSTGQEVVKIEENSHTPIDVTSENLKFYIKENRLIFTFDQNRNTLLMLTIDLLDYSYDIKHFNKPFFEVDYLQKKSNSFILEDKLLLVGATNGGIKLRIHHLESGDLIKEFFSKENEPILFKNTSFIQEKESLNNSIGIGKIDKYRELEDNNKFLRKIMSGRIGVSAYSEKEKYVISIGSVKDVLSVSDVINMGVSFSPSGGAFNIYFNPTNLMYDIYSYSKSTYFKSLMDNNFNHIKGKIKNNAFDKLMDFDSNNNLEDGKTIFKYKEYYILGSYLPQYKIYVLSKFDD